LTVLDASVVVEVLLGTPAGVPAQAHLRGAAAPHLLDLEVAQALRRYALSGQMDDARGREAIEDLAVLPIRRYGHGPLMERIWELRGHMTAYDAAYVALAEALDAPLLTRDRRLAAAPGHRARVELLGSV
jgi:predicted nucleic acid-binding protein